MKNMKWISINERLPEHGGDYLVTGEKYIKILEYNPIIKAFQEDHPAWGKVVLGNVTHWMPLPDLPHSSET